MTSDAAVPATAAGEPAPAFAAPAGERTPSRSDGRERRSGATTGTRLVLRTRQLAKVFKGVARVRDLNLEVPAGSVFGFLGPNGAGKSTTIRMLLGLVRPTRGTIAFDGRPPHREGRAAVGAMIEAPCFYGALSGRQNLKLYASLTGPVSRARLDEALAVVGLSARADDPVRIYSQGMKQRLGIAQALLPAPTLLILDEPTNGLDPQGVRDMRELIRRLNREWGLTIFLSSHLLAEVERLCDRVAIIHEGACLFQGTVEALRARFPAAGVSLRTGDPAAARALLGDEYPLRPGEDGALELELPAQEVPALVRRLVAAGLEVHTVLPRRRDLEDLFLAATGAEGGVAEQ